MANLPNSNRYLYINKNGYYVIEYEEHLASNFVSITEAIKRFSDIYKTSRIVKQYNNNAFIEQIYLLSNGSKVKLIYFFEMF